ncbi:MAG: WecB/TagA/CpsF family glycosyltransferase [Candidatus Omnitrophota bacterium]|nr:MAG: WecB/TagA/CpsF family glycosyltransferase [Candidatus Omnitrophota bacterium]
MGIYKEKDILLAMAEAIDFFGVKVSKFTKRTAADEIVNLGVSGKSKFITYLNAHCFNLFCSNEEYRKYILSADCIYADGQSIVWASKLSGGRLPERINASDLIEDICLKARAGNMKLFILCHSKETCEKTISNLTREFPGLKISGCYVSGDSGSENDLVNIINQYKPDILMVGLGPPYQEGFIYRNRNSLNVNLCWAVGGLFDLLSGKFKRAPLWIRKYGLEWLFRLSQEPKRLWRRYLLGNFIFIFNIIKSSVRIKAS